MLVVLIGLWPGPASWADGPLSVTGSVIRWQGLPSHRGLPVITAVRLHPNGRFVVLAGDDHVVRIWDLQQQKLVHELRGHIDWVGAVAFSPNGRLLASAGNDQRVILSEVASGKPLAVLEGHRARSAACSSVTTDGCWR